MADTDVINGVKSAVGKSLAGPAGELCMRTRCQDIVPRQLSSACRKEGRGKNARRVCRPLLAQCQNDEEKKMSCAESCKKYYDGAEREQCVIECMRAHCRLVPRYEECVMMQKIVDVLNCMENGEGRKLAESCLERRCDLSSQPNRLQVAEE